MFVPSNQPEPIFSSSKSAGVLVANYDNVSDVYISSVVGELLNVDANGVPTGKGATLLAKAGSVPLQFPTFKGTLWARAVTSPGTDLTVQPYGA